MKAKIFEDEGSPYGLELQVNDWLKKHQNIKVLDMSMACDSYLREYFMTILYEEYKNE